MKEYDAIVIGLGAMGSAALCHLARRGWRTLGLEQFDIPHEMGSSHGHTRMIRYTLQEHPSYVPLVRRAYELWRQLENQSGERLLVTTGSLRAGNPEDDYFQGALTACQEHNIPYEILSAPETARRFPACQFPPDISAIYQADGGFLLPERCIVNHINAALEAGAEAHGREQVLDWQPSSQGVTVHTPRAQYRAARLILTAGPWTAQAAPILTQYAIPERQVMGWFQPQNPSIFRPHAFPVFGISAPVAAAPESAASESAAPERYEEQARFYGFPIHGIPGVKIGRSHHRRQTVDNPDHLDRTIHPDDEAALRACLERYFPQANGPALSLKACMYTNSPDGHFIIDTHPQHPQVSLAAGFSGHGFKFASVIGEILADLAIHHQTPHDLTLFRLNRFNHQPQPC